MPFGNPVDPSAESFQSLDRLVNEFRTDSRAAARDRRALWLSLHFLTEPRFEVKECELPALFEIFRVAMKSLWSLM
jgi:hypothetical protein